MSEQLEIEFKTLLVKSDFERLLEHFVDAKIYQQTNYYFDTPDFQLKEQQCGLRIRLFTTYAELTLKSPQPLGLLETTDTLQLAEAKALLKDDQIKLDGKVAQKISEFGIDPASVTCFADLTTTRHELKLPEGLLALDESTYGKTGHDYELELEVTPSQATTEHFQNFLATLNLSYHPVQNKIKRALAERQKEM
ncbi:CYTH domain-containing protein [uncultured Enterococcus sp.]|uniref:CYTH domain-containing protein n=1 Tax=uncultured Enterococcus sp. TaxID=167972 RepID=UPI0025D5C697|nr:CYTH domain-containing protein [uncultured Enterococcus sp.]